MKVWLNGNVLDEEQALIPVSDRAVLYGDALFETFRTYGGVPFRLESHLERLRQSCEFFRLALPCERNDIDRGLKHLLDANSMKDAAVRLTVTRGPVTGPLGLAGGERGNAFMTLRAPAYPEALYREGMKLIVSKARRNSSSPISRHKTANYLEALAARQEATDAGADEALMLDEKGFVAECATANVFAVRGGVVWTPPLEAPILPGVTRAILIELCRRMETSVREDAMTLDDLRGAEEIFVTNSVMELMPVRSLDGNVIGTGRPGAKYRDIHGAYRFLVTTECSH